MAQQAFTFRTWGGARKGAGRKPAGPRAGIAHSARPWFTADQPVHVTLRMAEHVWNLRSERSFLVICGVLSETLRRPDFQVIHFAIQGNHIHLIAEAAGLAALSSGVRSLEIRLTNRLNKMMGKRGPVLADRYHVHVLRTPTEVRNALRYVLGNHAKHAREWGAPVPDGFVDPFSSAGAKAPRSPQLALWPAATTSEARTWLLTSGEQSRTIRDHRAGGLP